MHALKNINLLVLRSILYQIFRKSACEIRNEKSEIDEEARKIVPLLIRIQIKKCIVSRNGNRAQSPFGFRHDQKTGDTHFLITPFETFLL